MRTALVVFVLAAVIVVVFKFVYPRHRSISYSTRGGAGITLSREGVSFNPAPNHYTINGFDHIDKYISSLLVPTPHRKFLSIFTPDGNRGFGLDSRNGLVNASLTVEWQRNPQRETAIRTFFTSLGITPSQDYLAGNGGVPDATRILEYPITGTVAEMAALTKRILLELCEVKPTEALDFRSTETKTANQAL